ncbi:hypothetical protein [Glutamicibacter sp. AOP5-A2-18]|uniref:hypothetical protein n=1 Tax=Glutamicibacter sp. AOP5-A2-18 TaxID=3457656 RepID=UPI004033D7B3
MSANEKHAATYHGREYTPTTEQVREACILGHYPLPSVKQRTDLGADFDRWLETVRAEAKAEALNEAAEGIRNMTLDDNPTDWLTDFAEQYKEEPADGR